MNSPAAEQAHAAKQEEGADRSAHRTADGASGAVSTCGREDNLDGFCGGFDARRSHAEGARERLRIRRERLQCAHDRELRSNDDLKDERCRADGQFDVVGGDDGGGGVVAVGRRRELHGSPRLELRLLLHRE